MELVRDTRSAARLVLLAIIAAFSTVIMLQTTDVPDSGKAIPRLGLSYFIKAAELRGTGEDGNVLYRVKADFAQQLPNEDNIGLKNVAMSYEPAADVPWDLFADSGTIPPDGNRIELNGNVVILSKQPDAPQIAIRSSKIDVLPTEEIAVTDRKVVIEREGRRLNGTGMHANLKTSNIRLLSNVNGKYAP